MTSESKKYITKAFLGSGAFGTVYLAEKLDGSNKSKLLAIKNISKTEKEKCELEYSILKKLEGCIYFPKCYEYFEGESHFKIVMEYLPGGNVFEYLKKRKTVFPTLSLMFLAAELSNALFYMHNLKILHQDLSLQNILISRTGHAVLNDFGLSINLPCKMSNVNRGKSKFSAPEMFTCQGYDYASDFWSLGIVLHIVATKKHPYDYIFNKDHKLEDFIGKKPDISNTLCSSVKLFIHDLLKRNPDERLGKHPKYFDQIKNHEFLKYIPWENIFSGNGIPPFKN